MFEDESCEFEEFDSQVQVIVDKWKTLFNPVEGNLTTSLCPLQELHCEEPIYICPDIVMLPSSGAFGRWNFGFVMHAEAAGNGNVSGARTPPPQPSVNPEGDVVFHYTDERGRFRCKFGGICPWCWVMFRSVSEFGSVSELGIHMTDRHNALFGIEVFDSSVFDQIND
jgi:hypothetical protein